MARTILRAGRIAAGGIIAVAVLGVVLYWAGVISIAETSPARQTGEVIVVDPEAGAAAAEAAIAAVEKVIREHLEAKRYGELEAYCNGVLAETPYAAAAVCAKDAIVRSYILTGRDAEAAAATGELLNQFGSVRGTARALCNIGDAWRNQGKLAGAQQVYREAVLRYPGDEFARWSQLHLCMISLELKDVEAAAAGVRQMIAVFAKDPGMPLAAIQVGEEFFKAGHRDIALEIYHAMLENHADNDATVWAQKNICVMLIDAGNEAGAAAAVETLVTQFESAGTTPAALMEVGDRYRDSKRLENALQAYQYAAACDPNRLDARTAVCQTHLKLNDVEAALEVVWGMIADLAKDSGMPLAAVQMGEELARARHPEAALEIYRYLVEHHADNDATVWAQKNICVMLIDAGDEAGAAAAVATLVTQFESAGTTPSALMEVGDRYRDTQKLNKALQAYQYAAAGDPNHLDARKALCLTQLKLKDAEGAAETARRMMAELADNEWMALAAVQVGEEFAKAGRGDIAMEIYQYMVENLAERKEAAWAQKDICMMLIEAGDEAGAAAAIGLLGTKFKAAPTTPESLLEIGDKYCDLKQFDRALEVYRLAAAGESNALYAEKAKCLALVQLKDLEGAGEAAWGMILDFAADERMPLAAVQVGDALLKAGRGEAALEIYQYMVNNHVASVAAVWAQKNICDMLIDAGDDAGAAAGIEKLKTYFRSEETVAAALIQVADKYSGAKDYDRASRLYEDVKAGYADTPSYIWACQNLVRVPIEKDVQAAEATADVPEEIVQAFDAFMADFAESAEVTSASCRLAETYYNGAKAHERAGRNDQSMVAFRKALPLFDKVIRASRFHPVFTPDAWYMSAVAYGRLGEYSKGIECHRLIVDNWPDHHLAWSSQYWIGTFYQELKQTGGMASEEADAKSEEAFLSLFAKYPGNAMTDSARSQLGMIYFKNRRWEKAAGIYEVVVGESPPDLPIPKAAFYLARAYERMGQIEMALQTYREFLNAWPETATAKYAKAAVEQLGGQP
jgi:tetratricopeptide (TPR) repeat protein